MSPFEEWNANNQHESRRLARDPEVKPLHLRVMFAAEGWANLIGHAEFSHGGLALVLQSTDPQTGEIHIPSRSQVGAAIRRAIEMRLIEDGSTIRCLMPNVNRFHKSGGRGGKTCQHHGIDGRKRRRNVPTIPAPADTSPVSPSLRNDTPPVSPRHISCVGSSGNPPISDLFSTGPSGPGDHAPDLSAERTA